MTDKIQDMTAAVAAITLFITTIVGFLTAITELAGKLKILKPVMKALIFFGIQIIPIGAIIWYLLYVAVTNSSRLLYPSLFLLLVAQGTVAIFLYSSVWGIWLYPKLWQWLRYQNNDTQPPGRGT